MKSEWNDSMAEATRLVNAGNLQAATAMIQRALGNTLPAGAAAAGGSASQRSRPEIPMAAIDAPVRDYLDGVFERVSPEQADSPSVQSGSSPADASPRTDKPAEGRFNAFSYQNAAGTRAYKLYVPAGDASVARPLIVMLHGCTQGPDDFATGTRMNALADRHGLLVAYPAQPQTANNSKCWNWFNTSDQHRDRGEPSLIAGIVGDIRSRHLVDADRIHVVGFSAGAAMAAVMATEYPDLFASAAIHSGLAAGAAHDVVSALATMRGGPSAGGPLAGGLPAHGALANGPLACGPLPNMSLAGNPLAAGKPSTNAKPIRIPLIVFHGDRDTLVHPRNGEHIVQQWAAPGNASPGAPTAPEQSIVVEHGQAPGGRPYTRRILRGTTERPLLEHWRVHGGAHGWFGGSPTGSHTDPKGPDASSELVRFFAQNPRRAEDELSE